MIKNRFVATLLRYVAYTAFFLTFFLVFVYITFPYDRLRESIIAAAEAPRMGPNGQMQPSNIQLSIGKLSPVFPLGLKASDVTVTFLSTKPNEPSVTMKISSFTMKAGMLALLSRRLDGDITIDGLGGTMQGQISMALGGIRPGVRDVNFKLDRIAVGQVAPMVQAVGLPLFGTMNGTLEFHAPDGRLDQANGQVALSVSGFKIGDNKAQYPIPGFATGLTIAQINAGTLTANIRIKDGNANFERVQSRGDEFEFAMDGRLELRPVFSDSIFAAGVRFKLTDKYRDKSEQAGNIMMVLGSSAQLNAAKRPDGLWGFRCTGPVRQLRCPADPRGGTAPPANNARRGFTETQ